MFDKSLIDEITKRADIVSVVGNYIKLIKKGRIYVGICPFHDDSNPSLQVNPERNTFHCWVDGHSGNAISFVMQYEHINFPEAVKKVAEIINFDDPRLHEQGPVKKVDETLTPLIKCINDLNSFYEYALSTDEGKDANNYLNNRHIEPEACKKFHIGYSLNDGIKTIKFLQSKGHSLKTIEDIGIATNIGEKTHDRNQGRVTFALTDLNGQVVGFSARQIVDDGGPKYVNSPETKLFTKGKVLYNFNNAKEIAKNLGHIYVLEGFMDVIALDKIHVNNAIALMGTALSKDHIEVFKKLRIEVRLCLDGDLPGQEASMRIVPTLLNNKIPVRIVNNLNDNRDPDEILNEQGEEALKKYLNNLLSPFDFTINFYKNSKKLETVNDKKALILKFMPLLLATTSQIELDDYVYKLSDVTNFSSKAIKDAIANVRRKKNNETTQEDVEPVINYNDSELLQKALNKYYPLRKQLRRLALAEERVLTHMFNSEDAIKYYEQNIQYFYTDLSRDLVNYVLDYHMRYGKIDYQGILNEIESGDSKFKNRIKLALHVVTNPKLPVKYSLKSMDECKKVIDNEKKLIYEKEKITKATEGKNESEKARIIADALRLGKK